MGVTGVVMYLAVYLGLIRESVRVFMETTDYRVSAPEAYRV
jgi:hypothetical protein